MVALRRVSYVLTLIAVMLALLALGAYDVLTGRRPAVSAIGDLTIIDLANAKMSAEDLISSGVCAQPERHMLLTVTQRIDDELTERRREIDRSRDVGA